MIVKKLYKFNKRPLISVELPNTKISIMLVINMNLIPELEF